MEDKLPHIFTNNDKIISNNRKFYYSDLKEEKTTENKKYTKEDFLERYNLTDTVKTNNINTKIINLFKHSNSIYKIKVRIKTKDKEEEKYLIGRTNKSLIALDGETINISDIEDIELAE